jgi:hypothetical protein
MDMTIDSSHFGDAGIFGAIGSGFKTVLLLIIVGFYAFGIWIAIIGAIVS